MPSLRRTASSPSVRLAPYSYLSPQVARGHGHRRSSGSETSSRRVLADIEWWKVTDGQCDTNVDQESEDSTRDDEDNVAGAGTIALSTELGVEHHSTQIPWILSIPMSSPEVCVHRSTCPFASADSSFFSSGYTNRRVRSTFNYPTHTYTPAIYGRVGFLFFGVEPCVDVDCFRRSPHHTVGHGLRSLRRFTPSTHRPAVPPS